MKFFFTKRNYLIVSMLICQSSIAQIGITGINTINGDLPSPRAALQRKGAGVTNANLSLENRWDSVNTSFKLFYNEGVNNITSITDINIEGVGTGFRMPHMADIKVRRVANVNVNHSNDHFSYFATVIEAPSPVDSSGSFFITTSEVNNMETALLSNNINSGYDNVFQNSSSNVHYGNIERIDYSITGGFFVPLTSDLNKIGFTIYDNGNGGTFKIAGIKNIGNNNEPIDYNTSIVNVDAANFGNNLLSTEEDFIVFQKDASFNSCESRPSLKIGGNLRGVFISLAELGFTSGQTVYGFSLFADDIASNSSVDYLKAYDNFPTNSNNQNTLDLVNSIGFYNFNLSLLASSATLKASLQNNKVVLNWNTISNINLHKIYLQKAGKNELYINIAEVNNNQTNYIDETITEDINYYRLKIITTDGVIKYSNAQFINSKIAETTIYPTLANDVLYISSNSILKNTPITFFIHNVEGKLVKTITEKGNSFMNINIATLQKGMYIIKLMQNSNLLSSKKFIKN